MTSQGHPYAIFRRALERRSLANAWAAAAELERVTLADALELCLLVLEREPARYPRVAARWLGRYCLEMRGVTAAEAALVAAHLTALGEAQSNAPAQSLLALFEARGHRELARALAPQARPRSRPAHGNGSTEPDRAARRHPE